MHHFALAMKFTPIPSILEMEIRAKIYLVYSFSLFRGFSGDNLSTGRDMMTLQIRSRIEYLIQTHKILVLLHAKSMKNILNDG